MTTREEKRLVLVAGARKLINQAVYDRHASLAEAPGKVSCTSLTAYLYALIGTALPLSQQNEMGQNVPLEERMAGDLVFVFGAARYNAPGHVGIATECGTVIHADPNAGTVVESTLEEFRGDGTKMKIQRLL